MLLRTVASRDLKSRLEHGVSIAEQPRLDLGAVELESANRSLMARVESEIPGSPTLGAFEPIAHCGGSGCEAILGDREDRF